MDADDGLRASDRTGSSASTAAPTPRSSRRSGSTHLQSAFDELSDVHTKVLVMRELEGMSYREIGDKLDLTRPAVESALFRARRRLENEYEEIADGRRCQAMRATLARMVAGHAPRLRGAPARAAREALPQLPAPRARARDPAAVHGSARCARRPRRCCRSRGSSAARGDGGGITGFLHVGAGLGSDGGAGRGTGRRRRDCRSGRCGGIGGGALGGEREAVGEDRPAAAQSTAGERGIAARYSRARHGRGARRSAPGVRAEGFRSGGGPRRRFERYGDDSGRHRRGAGAGAPGAGAPGAGSTPAIPDANGAAPSVGGPSLPELPAGEPRGTDRPRRARADRCRSCRTCCRRRSCRRSRLPPVELPGIRRRSPARSRT